MTDYLVPQIRRSINQLVDLERIIWCLLFSLAGVAVTCDAESLVALYLPTPVQESLAYSRTVSASGGNYKALRLVNYSGDACMIAD